MSAITNAPFRVNGFHIVLGAEPLIGMNKVKYIVNVHPCHEISAHPTTMSN